MLSKLQISFGIGLLLCGAQSVQAEPTYGSDSDYHWVRVYDCVEQVDGSASVSSALPVKPEEACGGKARLREAVYFNAGVLHREGGPALLKYDQSGEVVEESWYLLGRLHRTDGPAERRYENGSLRQERWYQDGLRSRTGGPAETTYGFGSAAASKLKSGEVWFKNGLKHRTDGPAEYVYALKEPVADGEQTAKGDESASSFKLHEKWYQDGKLHRENGSALILYSANGDVLEEKKFVKGVIVEADKAK